jgi:dephospho-CoA kinase
MLRVGLTGGIGSGKSTVAARLAELGATVIDADRIAREVVDVGTEGLAAVVDTFGKGVLADDGSLDRAALAAIVFNDDAERARLNAIVHPLIGARTGRLLAEAANDAIVVHDVPLLVENGLTGSYHLVIVVDAPVEERVRRLVGSRGMTEADARARIATQASEAARRAAADVWLDNSGPRGQVAGVVDRLWAERLVPFEENVRRDRMPERGGPTLVPYDPAWPAQAERLMARLRQVTGSRVDHVGSTSVPGMAAKDVIDLQVSVPSLDAADELAEPLRQAGFPTAPEFTRDTPHPPDLDPDHWRERMAVSGDPKRWANVHLRVSGSAAWRSALLFRDWLRAEPGWRADYQTMKERTAADFADRGIPAYASAKQPWFERASAAMESWAERTGWRP